MAKLIRCLKMSIWILVLGIYISVVHTFENDYHQRDGLHVPCSFLDTVNITEAHKFENGSYLYEDVLIPPHLVGWYDYVYKDLVTQVDVKPHLRGCICKLKPCVTFCCPLGSKYNGTSNSCVATILENDISDPKINVTFHNGSEVIVDMFRQFAIQTFRPCQSMFLLQPERADEDEWLLFDNGSIFRFFDKKVLRKDEYCFIPIIYNGTYDNDTITIINPANCVEGSDTTTMRTINAYAMMFSIPFMLLTIVVYLLIPELRNQHGKSLVCYLIGLCVGYSLLCYNTLSEEYAYRNIFCKISGYTAYYFFMSAFLWLNVISFDLWHNFRGTRGVNRVQEKKRFLLYSVYAWGLAGVFFFLTFYVQEHTDIASAYKPGIDDSLCWLNVKEWSAMIYFFGPIIIIIFTNIVMFVMTALKIYHVQRELAKIMAREDSNRNLRSEKDKFGLFLRLFIVMGVTWSMEILSYFSGTNKVWSVLFYATDICNAIQGFLIFMLFVMKKKVKHLIMNRYSILNAMNQRQSQCSTKTTSSSVINLSTTTPNAIENPLMTQERFTCSQN